jgi:RNA polymerase sigma factor (sigma-70 family)
VDNPIFHEEDAEVRLFGPGVQLPDVPVWIFDGSQLDGKMRPSLSRDEERLLFLRYNYARCTLDRWIPDPSIDGPSIAEKLWIDRVATEENRLVCANIGLVVLMMRNSRFVRLPFDDLLSVGCQVVLGCVRRFDVSFGWKFSTYVCCSIFKRFIRINRQESSRELAGSLDSEGEMGLLGVTKASSSVEDADDFAFVMSLTNRLTVMERTALWRRFDLDRMGANTLDEVGEQLGVTGERVRQIVEKACCKLRNSVNRRSHRRTDGNDNGR